MGYGSATTARSVRLTSNCGTPKALSPPCYSAPSAVSRFVLAIVEQMGQVSPMIGRRATRSPGGAGPTASPDQRESFDAAEQPAARPPDRLRRDRETEVREAVEQLDHRHLDLEVRERSSDAAMRAPTEREVRLRLLAVEVE